MSADDWRPADLVDCGPVRIQVRADLLAQLIEQAGRAAQDLGFYVERVFPGTDEVSARQRRLVTVSGRETQETIRQLIEDEPYLSSPEKFL